jgi:polysaccharide biosynthesis/export protein
MRLRSSVSIDRGWIMVVIALTVAWLALLAGGGRAQPVVAGSDNPVAADYKLGPTDHIRITVFGEDNLTGEFSVTADGSISMPLVGAVVALGRTADQVRADIETRLKDGYIKDPRVSVEVLTYRGFYILGEVNKAGEYPYTPNLTVLGAVATAQGYTYRANTHRIFIKHEGDSAERAYPVTSDLAVQPGDVIRVAERFF